MGVTHDPFAPRVLSRPEADLTLRRMRAAIRTPKRLRRPMRRATFAACVLCALTWALVLAGFREPVAAYSVPVGLLLAAALFALVTRWC